MSFAALTVLNDVQPVTRYRGVIARARRFDWRAISNQKFEEKPLAQHLAGPRESL